MKDLAQGCAWWLFILLLLAGCGGAGATGGESPRQAQDVAFDGEYNEACFSDDQIDISLPSRDDDATAFLLTLTNKTGTPLAVLWDKVVFLDASGNVQHMIHQGVDYGQPLDALVPASLAQATLNDRLRPAKAVLDGDIWRLAPLTGGRDALGEQDQRLRIDLPLEINGRMAIYRFRFHFEKPAAGQAGQAGQEENQEWRR